MHSPAQSQLCLANYTFQTLFQLSLKTLCLEIDVERKYIIENRIGPRALSTVHRKAFDEASTTAVFFGPYGVPLVRGSRSTALR